MSALLPIVDRWEKEGYSWKYVWAPTMQPFQIPADSEVVIPSQDYVYRAKEGVIAWFAAGFDHPACGFTWRADPNLDLKSYFTIANLLLAGISRPEPLIFVMVPPLTPFYAIRVVSPWKWEGSFQVSVINLDTVPHTCIGYGYHMLISDDKPKTVEEK